MTPPQEWAIQCTLEAGMAGGYPALQGRQILGDQLMLTVAARSAMVGVLRPRPRRSAT
jgi:hypothetical protein